MAATEFQYTQEEIDDALAMLIAHAGNINAAIRDLKAQGKKAPRNSTLSNWSKVTHWERYEELREKYRGEDRGEAVERHA
jgi:cobalamin-dependent methionine synthase I